MARTDFEKKRKTSWPWFVGLAVLALMFVGISALLARSDDTEPGVVVPTVEDTYPPAAVPAPPNADPTVTGADPARGLDEIAPLGEEDIGQTISLDGHVVATGNRSFWLLAGDRVVRVDSPRRVRKDDTLSIRGTLQPADPGKTDRIASDVLSRLPDSDRWQVVRVIKIVEEDDEAAADGTAVPRPEA